MYKEQVGLLIIAVALCKSIYVLAAGFLLAVPFRHFKHKPLTLPATLVVIGVGLLAGFAWLSYSSQIVSEEMMNTGDQLRMFIGVLGWIDTVLPEWVYPLYYALLLSVVILEPHSLFFTIPERMWIAVLALATSIVMLDIFFYPDVSVGNGFVDIAQGRYYVPLGAFYFLPFSQRKWCFPQNNRFWVVIAMLHALVLLAAVRAMLWRYYAI